ncbi:MAG TPA: hypothetical protein VFX59_21445 [Polyangiales bacterium]|nr:hypothetical protein [Polyangiales bacterium]
MYVAVVVAEHLAGHRHVAEPTIELDCARVVGERIDHDRGHREVGETALVSQKLLNGLLGERAIRARSPRVTSGADRA